MELIGRAGQILLAAALVSTAQAQPPAPIAKVISFSVTRKLDGKKYPLPVAERYQLDGDGVLRYDAYFFNMPIEMNHNDSAEWQAGEAGLQVLDSVTQLLGKAGSGLRKVSDDEHPSTDGVWVITVSQGAADSTYIVDDQKSPAWTVIDTQFGRLISAFEKAAGRPRSPYELPQNTSDH